MPKSTPPKLEKMMLKLEGIVQRLEDDDIDLADAMKAFEEGIKLSRTAQQVLDQAEQTVQLLLEENGEPVAEPLAAEITEE